MAVVTKIVQDVRGPQGDTSNEPGNKGPKTTLRITNIKLDGDIVQVKIEGRTAYQDFCKSSEIEVQ